MAANNEKTILSTGIPDNIPSLQDPPANQKNIVNTGIPSDIQVAQDEQQSNQKVVVGYNIPSNIQGTQDDQTQKLQFQFSGGCNTAIEPSLLKPGEFSMIQNMRNKYPGLQKRKGCSKLHTTADGANEVMSMYQFSKGKITERHFYAQMSDGDVLEATTAPPGVTTGAFGTEVFDGTSSGQVPASWSVIDDKMIYSNGSDDHQIFTGNTSPVIQFIVYKGGAAIPTIPEMGEDYTTEVTDGDATTAAILDSLGDLSVDYDCIFICAPVQCKQFTYTVLKANGTAAVMKQNYWKNTSAWTADTITDNTAVAGATFGQSGSVTWSPAADEIPKYMFGRVGFWKQVYLDTGGDLDAEVEVSAVTYEANWQSIQNIWDGIPLDGIIVEHYDNSAGVYYTYSSQVVTLDSFEATNDKLYVCFSAPIEGMYADPGEKPNTTATTTVNAVYGWNGSTFTSVGTVSDGTAGFSSPGWITFPRLSTIQPSQFGKNKIYGYWYYFTTDKTLSSDVIIYIQSMPYYNLDDAGNGVANCSWKGRVCYTFSNMPEYILVSANKEPMVLNGDDSGILEAGDGRKNKIVAIRKFHNELMVWQEEKGLDGGCVTLFEGYSPSTFGKLVRSTQVGTLSNKTVDVVDGAVLSLKTDEPRETAAFWISHYGVYTTNGKVITSISADIQNYFDSSSSYCIRRGYEDKMWLKYDSQYNILRLGLVSGTTATKANVFPIYDIKLNKWLFDSLAQPFSCLTEAEAASGNIPILQVGGGTADGYVYLSNTGANDVSTAINAYAMMEINAGGDVLSISEISARIKSGEGTCTVTSYADGTAGTVVTIP